MVDTGAQADIGPATGSVSFERRDDVPWVVLTGAVDIYCVEPITDSDLGDVETAGRLYVDLSEVRFIDSLGVGLLLRLRQLAGEVHLVAPPREVSRVLELCGVASLFDHGSAA